MGSNPIVSAIRRSRNKLSGGAGNGMRARSTKGANSDWRWDTADGRKAIRRSRTNPIVSAIRRSRNKLSGGAGNGMRTKWSGCRGTGHVGLRPRNDERSEQHYHSNTEDRFLALSFPQTAKKKAKNAFNKQTQARRPPQSSVYGVRLFYQFPNPVA